MKRSKQLKKFWREAKAWGGTGAGLKAWARKQAKRVETAEDFAVLPKLASEWLAAKAA